MSNHRKIDIESSELARIEIERILNKIENLIPSIDEDNISPVLLVSSFIQNMHNNIVPMVRLVRSGGLTEDQFNEAMFDDYKENFILLLRLKGYSFKDIVSGIQDGDQESAYLKAFEIFREEIRELVGILLNIEQ